MTFEKLHGIRLPEEFRQFVTRVGHGGYGPTYGLLPMNRWLSGPARPGGAFPLIPDAELPEKFTEGYSDDLRPYPGAVTVVYRGCSDYTVLVVAGPGHGRLAEVNADRFFAPYFHSDAGFLSWYERWLDFTLSGHRDLTWFAQQMAGDEGELLTTLLADARATRRRAAAYTFITYPAPSRSLPTVLSQALSTEPHPTVRETIVRAMAAQGERGRSLLPVAMTDPSPRVRSLAAIMMCTNAPGGRHLAPRLAHALSNFLKTEQDDSVRDAIRRSLSHA
ncbi:SMI1/KNR4 family protein [Symbioplanes lichenis]|uniref:SMI1/KNR4 family protein n=1 Tax=Symbioplanes lichenis TaxID=1629072 RepID=UPI002739020B|nr:SMI1/KNR4 family protein [Actinoplanes lichenis]